MSLKRQLLVSFVLQGAGAASVLLATVLLGARFGPEVQGGFSRVKAELEFIAAFAMFGLPQALFFHVKAGALDARRALRYVLGCAVLALPLAALYSAWRHELGVMLVLTGIAVSAMVAHGQLRALLLVNEPIVWFNTLTAFPQVLVLFGVLYALAIGNADSARWPALFVGAYAGAAVIAWWRLHARLTAPGETSAGWRELGSYGFATWLTAALVTAAVLWAQRWVEATQGRAALGQFSMAMTLVQIPLTPISYAAPLLFRRWMERPDATGSQQVAAASLGLLLLLAALAWLFATEWPDLGMGQAYAGTTHALALLLAGGAAEAASRILTVQASASGRPGIALRAEAARWFVLVAGWLVLPAPSLLQICAIWVAGAWAAAGMFVWFARRKPSGAAG